jgi:hypothetical protein
MRVELPLLIDQQAATVPLSEADTAAWGAGQRVFVSSLIADLRDERAAARKAIQSVNATPVMFEELGARDISAEDAYLSGVRTSDVYVGILGPRYGVPLASGYSATHAEYAEAERGGLRMAVFVQENVQLEGPQADFISGIRNVYTTSPWSSAQELESRVSARLRDLAAESVAPWVRVGRVLMRADNVRISSGSIELEATVRDRSVFAELRRMADQMASTEFATTWQVETVQVTRLDSSGQSANRMQDSITMKILSNSRSAMRMSVNGLPAEELARRSLSDGLFETKLLPQDSLGGFSTPVDPLLQLRGRGLADDVARPIAHLLVAEHLLLSGEAATVDTFRLSPSRNGTRTLKVSWTPPRRYVNEPEPEAVGLEGTTRGI